jgi:hypothetical protein
MASGLLRLRAVAPGDRSVGRAGPRACEEACAKFFVVPLEYVLSSQESKRWALWLSRQAATARRQGLADRQGMAPAELEADLGLDDARVEQPAARRIIAEHGPAERKVPV